MVRPKSSEIQKQKPTSPGTDIWDELSAPFERDDDNLPMEKRTRLTDVQWIKKTQGARTPITQPFSVTINKTAIYFPKDTSELINTDHVLLGVGKLNGQPVLLIRPANKDNSAAYALCKASPRSLARSIANSSLPKRLQAAGLSLGRYELCKAKGGFIGVPIKKENEN